MSIIYEALQKIEKKEEKPGITPVGNLPVRKSSKRIFLIIFLGVALVVAAALFFNNSQIKTIEIGTSQNRKIASFLEKQKDSVKELISLQKHEPSEDKNVKTDEATVKNTQTAEYHLQGIIYDQKNPMAIINGKQLSVGEMIDGAKIISISQDGVGIESNGIKTYIPLES